MGKKGIFISATGQNVGKTTICLGLIAALLKQVPRLGVMKPVGQLYEKTQEGLLVDKDVVLFKECFHLALPYAQMSPVLFPAGFTRDYLDSKVSSAALRSKILNCYDTVARNHDFTIVEGTGHVGVGSIVGLNNADVAAALELDAILIAKGGVGSAFDELALNKALFDAAGVKIRGVILNKVLEDKRQMVTEYITKALRRWDIPLLGCIPYTQLLTDLSLEDYEILFETNMLSGEQYETLHFDTIRLVATSLETFKELTSPGQLIVTPATREDIIQALLDMRAASESAEPEHGLVLTGRQPPTPRLIERLKLANFPALYAPKSSFDAMQMITSYTAKIHLGDTSKIEKAIQLAQTYVDFSPCL